MTEDRDPENEMSNHEPRLWSKRRIESRPANEKKKPEILVIAISRVQEVRMISFSPPFLMLLGGRDLRVKHHDVIGVDEGVAPAPYKAANHDHVLWGDDHCLIRFGDDVDGLNPRPPAAPLRVNRNQAAKAGSSSTAAAVVQSLPRRRCFPGQSTSGWTTRMCRVSASLREKVFSSVHR